MVRDCCIFEAVAGSKTRRGILHYENGGSSFILDNQLVNTIASSSHVAVYITSANGDDY